MRTLIIAVVVLSASLSAHAEDMQKYLTDTQDLVRQGKHREALDRFLWFHDHALEHEPAMAGVRLSFALSSWKQLGDVYPPALTAMKKTRDDKTALLEDRKGNCILFHDVMSLNRTLGDDNKTVDLFRKLDEKQKDLAVQCWVSAKKAIINAKAYDLVRKYIGNPAREFSIVKEMYKRTITMSEGRNFGESFKAAIENNFVEQTILLIDVAVALDDTKAAKEVQKRALAIVDDYRLRDAIPKEKKKTMASIEGFSSTPSPQEPSAKETTAPMVGKNLISNASFEQDPRIDETIWSIKNLNTDLSADWSDTRARTGQYALLLSASQSGNQGWPGWFTAKIPLAKGYTYTFRAWSFTDDDAGAWVSVDLFDVDGRFILGRSTGCPSSSPLGSWTIHTLTVSANDAPGTTFQASVISRRSLALLF